MLFPDSSAPPGVPGAYGFPEFLQNLLDLLADDDPNILVYAARALRGHPGEAVSRALEDRLATSSEECVGELVEALEQLEAGRIGPLFERLSASASPAVRAAAADRLGRHLDTAWAPRIAAALDSESDPRCRASFLSLLGRLGTELPAERFLRHLQDGDSRVRSNVLELFHCLAEAPPAELVEPCLDDPSPRVRASAMRLLWRSRAEELWTRLREELESGDMRRELAATYLLGQVPGPPEALEALAQRLKHPSLEIRLLASRGLENVPGGLDVPALCTLYLAEENPVVRKNVLACCRRLAPFVAVGVFATLLENGELSPESRAAAARALGELQDDQAAPVLMTCLRDPDPRVRSTVVEALSKIGASGTLEVLMPVLEDSSHRVQATAALAIWRLGGRDAVEVLLAMLRSGEPGKQTSAAFALGEIGSAEVVGPLSHVLEDLAGAVVTTEAQRQLQKALMQALMKIRR